MAQSAKAHSSARRGTRLPDSDERRVSVALVVSKLAGVAVPETRPRMIACVRDPAGASAMRDITGPVMLEPSGFLAIGVTRVSMPAPGAMSACHPLATRT